MYLFIFRGQFYMYDILSKISNFNSNYVCSNLYSLEGYGLEPHSEDVRGIISDLASGERDILKDREIVSPGENVDKTISYVLSLEGGILNCNQPMLNNTEVKLSFDRALASIGLLFRLHGEATEQPTALDNKVLEIIDPYLEVEYISSPYLRNFYAQIEERPITMRYDDCNIYMKSISQGQSMIRVNNLMGGLTPDYIFAGFVLSDALNGDFNLSSTKFVNPGLSSVVMTLNGMAVQGYPMSIDENSYSTKLYSKFIDTIGKSKKSMAGSTIDIRYFHSFYSFISHRFEGEPTNEGWIGFDIKLKNALPVNITLGIVCYRIINSNIIFSSCFCNSKQCDCY